MTTKNSGLPKRFPPGTSYVLESRGSMQGMMLVHRYVRFPNGRQVELAARLVPTAAGGAAKARSGRSRRRPAAPAPAE